MYKVSKQNHPKHNNIIELVVDELGEYKTPFQAYNKAIYMKRIWSEETKDKVKILVNGQVMSNKQVEQWAYEEYKSLPKCEECAEILSGEVYNHQLSDGGLFCRQSCADKNLEYLLEKMNQDIECDDF
jgi:hypothetical protein